jgi:ketosteroid isomerase-like protein
MLTLDQARSHARDWCDAWNRRDLDAIMAHYAPDVAINSPTIVARFGHADGWLRGKEAVRANFAIGVQKEGLRFELVDVLLGVNAMTVIYRRENGALVADCAEVDEHGLIRRMVASYGAAA